MLSTIHFVRHTLSASSSGHRVGHHRTSMLGHRVACAMGKNVLCKRAMTQGVGPTQLTRTHCLCCIWCRHCRCHGRVVWRFTELRCSQHGLPHSQQQTGGSSLVPGCCRGLSMKVSVSCMHVVTLTLHPNHMIKTRCTWLLSNHEPSFLNTTSLPNQPISVFFRPCVGTHPLSQQRVDNRHNQPWPCLNEWHDR